MPLYHYKCSSCTEDFETVHSIKEPLWTVCPSCKNKSLTVVYDSVPVIITKEVKTIGQLAEKNAQSMGKELTQIKADRDGITERNQQKEKMSEMRKLANLSPEKKVKYIETGKI